MKRQFLLFAFLFFLLAVSSAGETRQTISLNGEWEAAPVQDADSDRIPEVFGHRIPVPGHWPLMTPEEAYSPHGALWYRTRWRAPRDLPPRAVLRIAKAAFGRTVFVNGVKADFYPYNFSASETDIRPYLKPGEDNEIVVRVKSVADVLSDGSPAAHNGGDYERLHYYPGIYDDVTLILSGWPAVTNLETRADLDRGLVIVRATLYNGGDAPVSGSVTFLVDRARKGVEGAPLAAGETRQVTAEVPVPDFDRDRDAWTPEHPRLYTLTAVTRGDDPSRRFGMRTFEVNPYYKCFLLNGHKRFLAGTNTDLFRFFDDPQCGGKPWDETWMRALFSAFKDIGWDTFRNCISAAPERWYDLCDEMGLMIQDEYPFWVYGPRPHLYPCPWSAEMLLPEYRDWLRDRGTHPSVVIIDLQNESYQGWFRDLAAALKPLDFQQRPFEIGWTSPNPDSSDVREYHPYFYIRNDFTPGYLNGYDGAVTDGSMDLYPGGQDDGLTKIINEYGWDWLNRNGDATLLGRQNYHWNLPAAATREDRRDYYAWSVGMLTEYWRVRSDIAGILHFTALTYSFDDPDVAYTGDVLCPDLTVPVIRPEVVTRFRSAFAPITVVLDDYREEVLAGTAPELDVVLLNERPGRLAVSTEVCVRLARPDGAVVFERVFRLSAPAHSRAAERLRIPVPRRARGPLLLTATLPDGTCSERRWNVLDRVPGFAFEAPVTASSQTSVHHGGRMPVFATDGAERTRWVCAPDDAAPWICVDLGRKRKLRECRIAWGSADGKVESPRSAVVSVSSDGQHFRPVATVPALRTARPVPPTERPSHAEWQSIRLPAVSARYVRVSAEGGLPCGLMSVAELDVR